MMQQIPSQNTTISCGHCSGILGTLQYILDNEVPTKHVCFVHYNNINIDFENNKMYGQGHCEDSNNTPVESRPSSSSCNMHASPMTESQQWTDDAVKLLINSYIENKDKFMSPLYNKKNVWGIISSKLGVHGVNKSATKCDEKWRNLKKCYDKVLQEKNRSGNSSVTWKFFNEFHEIYFKDPKFHPIATASSSGTFKQKSDVSSLSDDDISGNFCPGEKKRKRSVSALEIDQRRQKRHEERMKLKQDMFAWFKENYKKKKQDKKCESEEEDD